MKKFWMVVGVAIVLLLIAAGVFFISKRNKIQTPSNRVTAQKAAKQVTPTVFSAPWTGHLTPRPLTDSEKKWANWKGNYFVKKIESRK